MELDHLDALVGAAGDDTRLRSSILGRGEPLVLRLSGPHDPELVGPAAAAMRRMATVVAVVGDPAEVPGEVADAADVCLCTRPDPPRPWVDDTLEPIAAAVAEQPGAALALAALLRTTGRQPVWEAVVAEAATYGMLLGSDAHQRWLTERGPARRQGPDGPAVAVDRVGDVLRIELARPGVHNAVNAELRDQLVGALELAGADPSITAVELRGQGASFSAGGDLTEFGCVPDGATSFAVRLTRHPGLALAAVAARATVFLHGACIGAGIEVPAFCRTVVADPGAQLRLPELGMGLVPGAGGTVSIPRRIGRHRTAWLALTGAELDATTAHGWGLVDDVVPRHDWPSR